MPFIDFLIPPQPTHCPEIEVRSGDSSGEVKELERKAHLWSSLDRSEAS